MKHTSMVVAIVVLGSCGQRDVAPRTVARARPPAPVAELRAPPTLPPQSAEVSVTSKSPEALEEYKQGRDLVYNARAAEGVEHFKKAIQLDPGFAQAMAYLGTFTPGIEGVKMMDRAVELSADLPEPERVLIEALQARANDEIERSRALFRLVIEARPGDWRVQTLLSALAFDDETWEESAAAAQKAVDASPQAATAYNYLAYSLAWQGRHDQAIAVASKQTELSPEEPNPYDTLGEILLAAGRLDQAQATFEKASAKSAEFTTARVAAASIRAFHGDWTGAHARLERAQADAPRTVDALEAGTYAAWALAAQGRLGDMLRVCDAMERRAQAEKLHDEAALIAVDRGLMLALAGRPADAVAALDAADARAGRARLSPVTTRRRALLGLRVRLLAAWKTRRAAQADKLFAALAAEAMKVPLRRADLSLLDWGQGVLALTKGDGRSAVAAMKKCSELDTVCRFMRVTARRAAGDEAGAAQMLARLKASPRRDGAYLYFWATMK
jgi:tetratricopeptide (TPR) repeat protein